MNASTKNIVFDWNGTLIDDLHAVHNCVNIMFQHFGRAPVDLDFFRKHYEIPFEKLYTNHGFPPEKISEVIEISKEIFHNHYEVEADKAPLRDGALEILNAAQKAGIQSIILSNHIVEPIQKQLRRLAVEHHFLEILAYPDRASQGKDITKGQKLKTYMTTKAARPEHTIIIGDSVEEIEIAHQQGLISVAITGGCVGEDRLSSAKPDHLIHSLHELKPILQERGFVS